MQNRTTNFVATDVVDAQWCTPVQDMVAFDNLPKSVRDAVNDASYSMNSQYILGMREDHTIRQILREIRESSAAYVGEKTWRPIGTISGSSSSPSGKRASAYRRRVNARTSSLLSGLTIRTVAEC